MKLSIVFKIHFLFNETKVSVVKWLNWYYKLQHLFCGVLYNQWKCKKRTVPLGFLRLLFKICFVWLGFLKIVLKHFPFFLKWKQKCFSSLMSVLHMVPQFRQIFQPKLLNFKWKGWLWLENPICCEFCEIWGVWEQWELCYLVSLGQVRLS